MTEGPKALAAATLTHIDLGNHNAGEGGSQLSDLKRVGNRPYISGQAYRHAIKDALRAQTSEGVDCTPQHACGDIESCKLCDLFGYMNTDLRRADGEPKPKRVSPLRVAPLVGQYNTATTTDMILQYAVGGDVKKTDEDDGDGEELDNRIGYREMTENVFKNAWALDVAAIGQRETEDVDSSAEHDAQYTRKLDNRIDNEERTERVSELLDALKNTTQLAGQARHMADFMPDFIIAASQPQYNQRIMNALHLSNEDRTIDLNALQSVLADLDNLNATVWAAGTYNPKVLDNWDELMGALDGMDDVTVEDSVTDCYQALKNHIKDSA
jgi:CRISPR-associated autoregulator DevR family